MKMIFALTAVLLGAGIASNALAQAGPGQARSKWSIPQTTTAAPDRTRKPCLRYGEGFHQIPGSDTCVKINGYVRGDYSAHGR